MLLVISLSTYVFVQNLINPRRACAARVTVLGMCVCLSVCLSTTILALQAMRRLNNAINNNSMNLYVRR